MIICSITLSENSICCKCSWLGHNIRQVVINYAVMVRYLVCVRLAGIKYTDGYMTITAIKHTTISYVFVLYCLYLWNAFMEYVRGMRLWNAFVECVRGMRLWNAIVECICRMRSRNAFVYIKCASEMRYHLLMHGTVAFNKPIQNLKNTQHTSCITVMVFVCVKL